MNTKHKYRKYKKYKRKSLKALPQGVQDKNVSVDIATNIMQLIIKSNIKLEHSTLHTKLYSLKKAIRNIPTNGHIKPI